MTAATASAPVALWNGPTDVAGEHVAVWKWGPDAFHLEWFHGNAPAESEGPLTLAAARDKVHSRFQPGSKLPFVGEAKLIRNVPYSGVWPGSRGGHDGRGHLIADIPLSSGRLKVPGGAVFCRRKFWDTRTVEPRDLDWLRRCPECDRRATKLGVTWPMAVRA